MKDKVYHALQKLSDGDEKLTVQDFKILSLISGQCYNSNMQNQLSHAFSNDKFIIEEAKSSQKVSEFAKTKT